VQLDTNSQPEGKVTVILETPDLIYEVTIPRAVGFQMETIIDHSDRDILSDVKTTGDVLEFLNFIVKPVKDDETGVTHIIKRTPKEADV